jgi:hypothetical protein
MNVTTFWNKTSCNPYINRRFGRTYHLHLQGKKLVEQLDSQLLHIGFLFGSATSENTLLTIPVQLFLDIHYAATTSNFHAQISVPLFCVSTGTTAYVIFSSLVSTTEELLERKSSDSGLENRDYGRRDPPR